MDDKRTADERHRQARDDEQKRIEKQEEDRKQREQAEADRRKQARDAPLVPNAEGNVMIEALMGPYRGQRLTVTAADGQAAINDHWARNPSEAAYEHEPLDEPDRVAAFEAAHAWANAQWEAAQDIDELDNELPAPEGETEEARQEREEKNRQREREHNERTMQPGAPGANYRTRTVSRQPDRKP